MAYKTVLTILHEPDGATRMIPQAAALAAAMDAHLDVLCLGLDHVQMGYYFAAADVVVQQTTLDYARTEAEQTVAAAEKAAAREDVRFSVRGVVAQVGAMSEVIAAVARFADLVVLPQPYGDHADSSDEAILEAALFPGQSPVLVLPGSGLPQDFGRRAVIGWNDGAEALIAVRAALPLLRKAETCRIAIIDPPERAADRAEPGRSLSTMLDRHGVRTEITLLAKTHPRIADVLADHVRDTGATLLVTGAYGHSRFRQAVLGGATRDLLTTSQVPVLMAH